MAATGDTGEADPYTAIEDALKTFDADRIVLFTHGGEDQRYREDLDDREIAERFRARSITRCSEPARRAGSATTRHWPARSPASRC